MRMLTIIDPEMMWADKDNAYLDAAGIKAFLVSFDSWLKDYNVEMTEWDEERKTLTKVGEKPFNEWLFEAATFNGIDPIMALSMLQKEQSLIQKWRGDERPPQKVIDWACGYDCPEDGGHRYGNKFKGFATQVKSMLGTWERYRSWSPIKNWPTSPFYLYDKQETVTAGNLETAMHLLYNPRESGVTLLKTIWDRYYEKAEKLGIIREGGKKDGRTGN